MRGRVKTDAIVLKAKARLSCDSFTLNPFHVKFMYAFDNVQAITYIEDY